MDKTEVLKTIDGVVKGNKIAIYMKGNRQFPRCGFSAQSVEILNRLGHPFADVDVMEEEGVWDGIQEYSGWPTFPQIFIDGKLVGGCDIVTELFESGELQTLADAAFTNQEAK